MTTCDRVSEPCGVELYLIGWYRQELHIVTSGNGGRPASRVQRRIAWREVQRRVAWWIVHGLAPDPAAIRVWQKITAHIDRTFAADQERQ